MRRLRRGFTLLELMIAITLMLIIMLMLRSMFVNAQTMYLRAAKRVDVYSQARATLDMMEQDLMRMSNGQELHHSINCRSIMPEDLKAVDSIPDSRAYSKLSDWAEPEDAQAASIHEFLSFTGRNTWFDKEKERYVTGEAFVAYYIRKRLPDKNGDQYAGGYLVRRIMPVRSNAEIVAIQLKKKAAEPLYPHEDELASFVYGVRVFVDDQAAFQLGTLDGVMRYNFMPEASPHEPNARWMWIEGDTANQIPAAVPVKPRHPNDPTPLLMPVREDRAEFGGFWSGAISLDRKFTSARGNYPSVVMVDLMMIDRTFDRYDANQGSGTWRSFSRAVQLPISKPMTRLDQIDRTNMK